MNEQEKALASFRWIDNQRILFVLVFILGALGILLSRELGAGVITAVVLAVGAMGVYVAFGAAKKFMVRPDVLGDNTYYLGFLFTLVSLAYTLYKYSYSPEDVDRIIQNFGIALSTTLVGLVVRVYFNRTRDEPVLYENAVRMSLAEQAAALIGETANIRNDVMVLRTSIQQVVNEGIEASMDTFRAKMTQIAEAYQDELKKSSSKVSQVLQETLSDFSAGVNELNNSLKSNSVAYQDSINSFAVVAKQLVLELRDFATQISELKSIDSFLNEKLVVPLNELRSTLLDIQKGFSGVTLAVAESQKSVEGFSQSVSQFKSVDAQKLQEAIDQFTSLVSGSASTMMETIQKMKSSISSIEEAYLSIPEKTRELNKQFILSNDEIQKNVAASQALFLEVEESLIKLANQLIRSVSETKNEPTAR